MEKPLSMDSLLELIKEACKSKGISFNRVPKLLEYLVGTDTIIDHYISEGPFPERKDVLLDVFILSPSCLYNLDYRHSAILCHRLFLDQISLIEETTEHSEDDELYLACYIFTGMHHISLREKESKRDDIEKFFSKLRESVTVH